jgi:Radial spokehead-like protein
VPMNAITGRPVKGHSPNLCSTENIIAKAELLSALGHGLDLEEMYGIALQAKRVSEGFSLKSIRFFGKIFGVVADYYVFEATPREQAQAKPESPEGVDGACIVVQRS